MEILRTAEILGQEGAADDLALTGQQRSVGLTGKGGLGNPPNHQRIDAAQNDQQGQGGQRRHFDFL